MALRLSAARSSLIAQRTTSSIPRRPVLTPVRSATTSSSSPLPPPLHQRARLPIALALALSSGYFYYYFRDSLPSFSPSLLTAHAESPKRYSGQEKPPPPLLWTPPTREDMLNALRKNQALPRESFENPGTSLPPKEGDAGDGGEDEYDLLIIGGGATGAGVALDAASRGLRVALVERDDWSSGTSSKSTKLIHGGVRYLQKAVLELDYEQWKLVREALRERKVFLEIAPYLSSHLPIMLPIYKWWQVPYYWSGCKLYDLLAGTQNMESSYLLNKGKAIEAFPMLKSDNLKAALVYYDGQHNDSRMNMSLVLTAVHHGAVAANYAEVTSLLKREVPGKAPQACGAVLVDKLTGEKITVRAKGVVNATGPFTDAIRRMDDPSVPEIVAPSGGVHITLPSYYSPKDMGLIDPATSDGRVIFFLPWEGNAIAGTTDSPTKVTQNPLPKEEEIQWILDEVKNYLSPDIKVRRGDVLSAWSGIRPLVRDPHADPNNSSGLVRNHVIHVSPSSMITIAGGKWTTYRAMAEETVDEAVKALALKLTDGSAVPKSETEKIKLVGSHGWTPNMYVRLIQQFGLDTEVARHLQNTYGDRAWGVCSLAHPTGKRWPVHGKRVDENYPFLEEEITYACKREYCETATDFIARRTRLAFLNAQAALEALPKVIDIMAKEKGWGKGRQREEFEKAKKFLKSMGLPEERQSLSMEQVRKGLGGVLRKEAERYSRMVFGQEELEELEALFQRLDVDRDGKISHKDLMKVMADVGFATDRQMQKQAQDVLNQVDKDADGKVGFDEFLDIASGMKELQLENAFTRIVDHVKGSVDLDAEASSQNGQSTSQKKRGQASTENSWNRWWRRTIPVERSGGGT